MFSGFRSLQGQRSHYPYYIVQGQSIPVYNVLTVQVVQSHDNFTGKENSCWVVKAMRCAQVSKKFSSKYIFQQHVQKTVVMVSPEAGRGKPW